MSIEQTLISIAESLSRIAAAMETDVVKPIPAPVPAPVPVPAPAPEPIPVPLPMPAAFTPPPARQPDFPFADRDGLLKYTMEKYRSLGATKGGAIPGIVNTMGFKNVAEIPQAQWENFYRQCEAL